MPDEDLMPPGTLTRLVRDLERKPPNALRDDILERARRAYYHDFLTDLPLPKVQLVADLERYGFRDLARKARRGEYDDEIPPGWDPIVELKIDPESALGKAVAGWKAEADRRQN